MPESENGLGISLGFTRFQNKLLWFTESERVQTTAFHTPCNTFYSYTCYYPARLGTTQWYNHFLAHTVSSTEHGNVVAAQTRTWPSHAAAPNVWNSFPSHLHSTSNTRQLVLAAVYSLKPFTSLLEGKLCW